LANALDERFTVPSAKKISATLIPKEHQRVMSEEVIPLISQAGDLCSTTDAWKNKAREHLTTTSLHFILPATGEMVEVNIETKPVGEHEGGTSIASHLQKAYASVGASVPARVIYSTADRAANQSAGIRGSGAIAMYCNVHILGSIVKHVFKHPSHTHMNELAIKSHRISLAMRETRLSFLWRKLQLEDPSTKGIINELIPHMDVRFLTIEITFMRVVKV
jgi:hypothetical protein